MLRLANVLPSSVKPSRPPWNLQTPNLYPFSNVAFDGETATLSADSKYELDNLVTALNTFPAVSVAVSASGSEAAARAATVIKYLTDRGIGADRLKAGAAAESGVSLTISR
jgi:outer membrane protein OmpA-like peptidoglycan-associated protein